MEGSSSVLAQLIAARDWNLEQAERARSYQKEQDAARHMRNADRIEVQIRKLKKEISQHGEEKVR